MNEIFEKIHEKYLELKPLCKEKEIDELSQSPFIKISKEDFNKALNKTLEKLNLGESLGGSHYELNGEEINKRIKRVS